MNFEVKGKFKAGYYTCENFNSIPTYWLVFEDKPRFHRQINLCGLVITLFKELPEGAKINAHEIGNKALNKWKAKPMG